MREVIKARAPKFVLVVFSFFVFSTFGFSLLAQAAESKYLKLYQAHLGIWKVQGKEPGTSYVVNGGSAFAINPNTLVTNAHVFRTLQRNGVSSLGNTWLYQVWSSSRRRIDKIWRISGIYDLAIIKTRERVRHYLGPAANSSLHQLTRLSLLGYPEGRSFEWISQKGRVTFDDPFSYSIVFATDTEKLSGTSGGPILNSNGKVVGVMVQASHNIAFGVKIERIREIIKGEIGNSCRYESFYSCLRRERRELLARAEEKDPIAQSQLFDRLRILYKKQPTRERFRKMIALLKDLAEKKHPIGEYELAWYYIEGKVDNLGSRESIRLGCSLMLRSARQKYVFAEYSMCTSGDREEKKAWMRKAVDQGLNPAEQVYAERYGD